MRILFCNYEYPPLGGGGGVINALLAEELAKRHEVTVLTSRGRGLPSCSEDNGVNIIRVPVLFRMSQSVANIASMVSYLPMGIVEGKRLLRQRAFDVINTHFVLPTGPVGHMLAQQRSIPNVLSVHGGDLYDPSKWISPHRHATLRFWIRKLLRKATRVVAQSSNTANNVHEWYGDGIPVNIIPLGIRRPGPDRGMREQYGLRTDDVVLVTVGRLIPRKANDQLIWLMSNLRDKNAKLLIIGTGPEEGALRSMAYEYKVSDSIHFLGWVDEEQKCRILRMADIYISASQHEGFGLVFLEAMAAGLPVICYDHGGQMDFLRNGHTGSVVPLNHKDEMLIACRDIVNNPDERIRMGRENERTVEQFYIDRCAASYEELFTEVLEQARLPKRLTEKPAYTRF